MTILVAGCGGATGTTPPSAPSPLLAQTAPDFRRPTLNGAKLDTKTLRGKVLVVKFFAKYCEPCKRTLPALERLASSHTKVAFLGVGEDERESDVREVVSTYGLSFPVVHDRGNVLAGRFRVSELPLTFVVDGAGNVRWVGGSEQTETELAQAIEAVVK